MLSLRQRTTPACLAPHAIYKGRHTGRESIVVFKFQLHEPVDKQITSGYSMQDRRGLIFPTTTRNTKQMGKDLSANNACEVESGGRCFMDMLVNFAWIQWQCAEGTKSRVECNQTNTKNSVTYEDAIRMPLTYFRSGCKITRVSGFSGIALHHENVPFAFRPKIVTG